MKNKKFRDAWNKVEPDQEADERMRKAILLQNTSSRKRRRFIPAVLISLALVLVITNPFFNKEDDSNPWSQNTISSQGHIETSSSKVEEPSKLAFNFVNSSSSIQINYVAEPRETATEASLESITEKGLLANSYKGFDLAAFHGTVRAIHNLEIIFKYRTDYFSIVELEIIEDFRTGLDAGTIVTLRMPGHIYDGGGTNTIMDIAGTLKVGEEAIMMPYHYNETSFYTETGGETVHLNEISQYGIGDGIRWLFVETDEGLVFERNSYPSFRHAKTLEDVAEIIRNW